MAVRRSATSSLRPSEQNNNTYELESEEGEKGVSSPLHSLNEQGNESGSVHRIGTDRHKR
jgi:hypothetical protein